MKEPISFTYEQADEIITSTFFQQAIKQATRQQKHAQAAQPRPHPSGLNRKQRRTRRHT